MFLNKASRLIFNFLTQYCRNNLDKCCGSGCEQWLFIFILLGKFDYVNYSRVNF